MARWKWLRPECDDGARVDSAVAQEDRLKTLFVVLDDVVKYVVILHFPRLSTVRLGGVKTTSGASRSMRRPAGSSA
jgi:hypothetical protein